MKCIYILFLFFKFCLSYNSPFIEYYKDNYTAEQVSSLFLQTLKLPKDFCLVPVEDTVKILKKRYGIQIDKKDVTNNLRFIVGHCNPIILVPGIFSVKLMTQIDCKGLYENERDNYEKLKFYCPSKPCDNIKDSEEYRLFMKLFGPFGFLKSPNDLNLYNACFSYFMTIFNDDECPAKKNICTKSDYIKVMFYGGTNDTIYNSKCGLEASRDVLMTHETMSNLIRDSKVYGDIIDLFINMGYEPGFSLGGIPNDFRKFVATNNFSTNVFRYLVDSFYNNTGKKVIIIAHSFGNLVALNNLVSEENKDLIPKIKKFVSIGPPFAGSTKLLDGYLHGLKDFNNIGDKAYYYQFGQSLLFKSVPTATELRPLSIFSKLLKNPDYKEFIEAIKERLTLEKNYINEDYDYNAISRMSEKFDKIYSSYFPSLKNNVCKENSFIKNKLQMKCLTNIYNIFDCPMIITLDNINDKKNIESYCNKNDDNLYYVTDLGEERKSTEELLTKGKFTYGLPEMDEFIEIFNKNYKNYKLDKKINISNFESEEEFRQENILQIEYYKNISLIQDLPIPPVDTDIIYTSSIDTNTGEFIRKNNLFEEGENIIAGGDGTVSTWSSLLVGLKWIYDKQKNNLTQKIRLVEYCSRLKDNFPNNDNSKFIALGCKCLNKNNMYEDFDNCDHQKMLLDTYLLSFLQQITSIEISLTEDRIIAAKAVLEKKNYQKICDDQLFIFAKSFNKKMKIDHSTLSFIIQSELILVSVITVVIIVFCWIYKCCGCCESCGSFKCCCCCCIRCLQICFCCKKCRCEECDCCCWENEDDDKDRCFKSCNCFQCLCKCCPIFYCCGCFRCKKCDCCCWDIYVKNENKDENAQNDTKVEKVNKSEILQHEKLSQKIDSKNEFKTK